MRYIIEKHGVTLPELARCLNCTYAIAYNMYNCITPLPLWAFATLVRAFNLSDEQVGTLLRISFDGEIPSNYTN